MTTTLVYLGPTQVGAIQKGAEWRVIPTAPCGEALHGQDAANASARRFLNGDRAPSLSQLESSLRAEGYLTAKEGCCVPTKAAPSVIKITGKRSMFVCRNPKQWTAVAAAKREVHDKPAKLALLQAEWHPTKGVALLAPHVNYKVFTLPLSLADAVAAARSILQSESDYKRWVSKAGKEDKGLANFLFQLTGYTFHVGEDSVYCNQQSIQLPQWWKQHHA